ncbi:MAG: galactonate dehydratase [Thermomicrobiales bacterium]|nr:MAG: galactonate dehydratase [Thermomicrobiales bacterium]
MRITDVTCYPVWGGFRNFLFIVIDTDEGISGVGESGLTGRELAVTGTIEHFKPLLIGQDPFRIEHLWQTLSRGGFFPAEGAVAAALSAIDIALWDIKGKALNVPIHELLGGRVRDKVIAYPHNGSHDPSTEALVESCLETSEAGWKFVRFGLPSEGDVHEPRVAMKTAIDQFAAVRDAVGDEIEITFDIHTRLDQRDSVYLCNELEQFRPFFIEDPVRAESMQALRAVRAGTNVPIAAGEQFTSKWQFRQIIEEDLIDFARIDLCLAGGFSESRKIAGWCETHDIPLAVHNPLGPVSSAACLQLNLATANFAVQEQPRLPGTMLTDVVPVQIPWEDGYLLPPDRPGLGIEFDREAALAHPFQLTEIPHLHRADGSFTNW